MPWVRFDDQYPIHRKVDGLSDAAFRLHTSAIFWCARNLTDGFVSDEDLDGVTARVRTPARFAAECVKRDVWHDARYPCPSEKCPAPVDNDGWVIHDYWVYQFTKEQVVRNRESDARRQGNYRERHRNDSSNGVTNGVSPSAPTRPVTNTGLTEPGTRASPWRPPSRNPSSRPVSEVLALPDGHQPSSPETAAAAASMARQALSQANGHDAQAAAGRHRRQAAP